MVLPEGPLSTWNSRASSAWVSWCEVWGLKAHVTRMSSSSEKPSGSVTIKPKQVRYSTLYHTVHTVQRGMSGILHSKLQLVAEPENDDKQFSPTPTTKTKANPFHTTNWNSRKRTSPDSTPGDYTGFVRCLRKYTTTRVPPRSCNNIRLTPTTDNKRTSHSRRTLR